MAEVLQLPAPGTKRHASGSEKRQRGGIVGFRASPGERAIIKAAADRAGLTVSSYVRSRLLETPVTRAVARPSADRTAFAQALGWLGKCGSNLNQIARVLNSGGDPPEDIAAAVAEIRAVAADLQAALGRRRVRE